MVESHPQTWPATLLVFAKSRPQTRLLATTQHKQRYSKALHKSTCRSDRFARLLSKDWLRKGIYNVLLIHK